MPRYAKICQVSQRSTNACKRERLSFRRCSFKAWRNEVHSPHDSMIASSSAIQTVHQRISAHCNTSRSKCTSIKKKKRKSLDTKLHQTIHVEQLWYSVIFWAPCHPCSSGVKFGLAPDLITGWPFHYFRLKTLFHPVPYYMFISSYMFHPVPASFAELKAVSCFTSSTQPRIMHFMPADGGMLQSRCVCGNWCNTCEVSAARRSDIVSAMLSKIPKFRRQPHSVAAYVAQISEAKSTEDSMTFSSNSSLPFHLQIVIVKQLSDLSVFRIACHPLWTDNAGVQMLWLAKWGPSTAACHVDPIKSNDGNAVHKNPEPEAQCRAIRLLRLNRSRKGINKIQAQKDRQSTR